jgi:hypothetical protein
MGENKRKLLSIYKKAYKHMKLPNKGLCRTVFKISSASENLELFRPSYRESSEIYNAGFYPLFWGFDRPITNSNMPCVIWEFTPLRQTILAFLIAMEDN